MNHSLKKLALLALLGMCVATPALAEGPMATDDAGTLDRGGLKIEGVLGRDDKARAAELGFGYGVIENVELGLAFARETDRADDPSTKLRATGISIKWVPIQSDIGWSLGASFGYDRTRAHIRSATPPDPEHETEKAYSVAGLATYRFVSGQVLHMNLGSGKVKGVSESTGTWGIGYEFPLMESLQLTVEVYGEEHIRPEKSIGLRYEILEGLKVYGSAGRGNDRSFGQVGVAWEF
jgi:hypothetical protein